MNAAVEAMEVGLARYMDPERRRSDLETELQVMQDDRARLALELDSTAARLTRVEGTAAHVGQRLTAAIGTIREVLARAEPVTDEGG